MKRLPNLDVLRFVLAFMVVIFHIPQLSRNQGLPYFDAGPDFHKGIEAVYVFFVLSGFLIIKLIYLEKLRGVFSIKRFYMRRILRIFPLYYLVVVFVALKLNGVDIISDNLMIVLINIFTFALTLIMAHLSNTYYESYFLKLKHKFRK